MPWEGGSSIRVLPTNSVECPNGAPPSLIITCTAKYRMLYNDLAKVVPLDQQTVCLQLLEETEPSIRCGFICMEIGYGDGSIYIRDMKCGG